MRYLQGKYRYFVKLGQDLTDSRKWYTGLGVRHTLEVRRKISIKRDSKYASTGFICKTNREMIWLPDESVTYETNGIFMFS